MCNARIKRLGLYCRGNDDDDDSSDDDDVDVVDDDGKLSECRTPTLTRTPGTRRPHTNPTINPNPHITLANNHSLKTTNHLKPNAKF